jgi:hypothetical protein
VTVLSAATLTDARGNILDGDGDFTTGDAHTVLLGRGTKFSIIDAAGDKGSLKLAKGGVMEFRLGLGDAAPNVQLLDVVAGSSALSGKVKKSKTGDGRVTIASLTGTTGVNLEKLVRCSPTVTAGCLDIGVLSAAVVDRLLEERDDELLWNIPAEQA